MGFIFFMFAVSAGAAGLGEPCTVDADCDDSVYCNGIESCSAEGSVSICFAGTPVDCGDQFCDELSQTCVDCLGDANCDDGVYCDGAEICDGNACVEGAPVDCGEDICDEDSDSCVECLEDLDCTDNATPLCSDAGVCVECIENLDCGDGQVCESGECIEEAACGLFIRPPVLNVGKKGKQSKQMFTIKGIEGEEGFDPYGAIDFGPFEVYRTFVAGGGTVLKVQILVPGDVIPEGEFFEVTVGSCTGQVYLKKPPVKEGGKKEKKEKKQKKEKP
jgi:Cys-rich repeat protein